VSGIAGILYLDGREVVPGSLRKMSGSLAYRSTNGSDTWSAGPVGLVHCLFAATPESVSSRQPLVYEGGRLVITADARIDNRPDLAGALGLQGVQVNAPDEYFILKAYEKWGADCARRLQGDFAFAIWDNRQQQLFCARDVMGVKPFYYYTSHGSFIFASEIKAILALDEVPRQLNELCLLDFLVDDRDDREITFFQGISRLAPAHSISVATEGFQIRLFWSLDAAKEVRFDNPDEYAENFLHLFTQAVAARLHSRLPVGCALSGGLDSSSVASMARNLLSQSGGGPLITCSALFSGLSEPELSLIDERGFIEKVLSTGGFEPCFVDIGPIGPLTGAREMLSILDEPVSAPTLPMFRQLYAAASQRGVGVYLEGIDGDLVVSHGYERFFELARNFKWAAWIQEVRDVSRRSGLLQSEIIKRFTLRFLIPPPIYQLMRRVRRRQMSSVGILDYLSAHFTRQESISLRLEVLNRRKNSIPRSAKEAHLRELSSGIVPLSLELLDFIASRCNIEIRYPFYDQRLVEYCFAIPVNQKLSGGWTRFILRDSMAGVVPEEIRWRYSKADFRPFIKSGLLRPSNLLVLQEMLAGKPAYLEPYLDTARLDGLYQRFASGAFCSTEEVEILYRAAMLLNWLAAGQLG
jgi:asparagine synthase (glutamine-hydrolysing)